MSLCEGKTERVNRRRPMEVRKSYLSRREPEKVEGERVEMY